MADAHRERVHARASSVGTRDASSTDRETLETLQDLSKLLNTGLSSSDLKAAMALIQQGYSPTALAKVVKDLRAEATAAATATAPTATQTPSQRNAS